MSGVKKATALLLCLILMISFFPAAWATDPGEGADDAQTPAGGTQETSVGENPGTQESGSGGTDSAEGDGTPKTADEVETPPTLLTGTGTGAVTKYAVWVEGKQFDSDNKTITLPDNRGTATFEPDTNTLILSEATVHVTSVLINGKTVFAGIVAGIPLTIKTVESCEIALKDTSNQANYRGIYQNLTDNAATGLTLSGCELTFSVDSMADVNQGSYTGIEAPSILMDDCSGVKIILPFRFKNIIGIDTGSLKLKASELRISDGTPGPTGTVAEAAGICIDAGTASDGLLIDPDSKLYISITGTKIPTAVGLELTGKLLNRGTLSIDIGDDNSKKAVCAAIEGELTNNGETILESLISTSAEADSCYALFMKEGSRIHVTDKYISLVSTQKVSNVKGSALDTERICVFKGAAAEPCPLTGDTWPDDLFTSNQLLNIQYQTTIDVQSVDIDGEKSVIMKRGETRQLKALVTPRNATSRAIIWSSSNPGAVSVTEDGLLTALQSDKTVAITAAWSLDTTVCCTLTVNVSPDVPATGVTISAQDGRSTADIQPTAQHTLQLSAVVTPPEASQTVTWSSANPQIATVDNNGLVTAVSVGTAGIIATAEIGGMSDVYTVKVIDSQAKSIEIKPLSSELHVGETRTLEVTRNNVPETEALTWSVISGAGNASIDNMTGVVRGLSAGTFKVRAELTSDRTIYSEREFTVTEIAAESVKITAPGGKNKVDPDASSPDHTLQLSAAVTPAAASQAVTWTSDSPEVATVDTTGKVTGIKAGIAAIRATASNGKYDEYFIKVETIITVTDVTIRSGTVAVDTVSIGVGETTMLNALVSPEKAAGTAVTWTLSSGGSSCMNITKNGLNCTISGTAPGGPYTLTATSDINPDCFDTVSVTITKPTVTITKTTGDITFTSLTGTKTLGVSVTPAYMQQYVQWTVVGPTGICTVNTNIGANNTAAVQPVAVGSTTVRASVIYNGVTYGTADFTVTVTGTNYAITKPSVNNSLIWYYDSSSKAGVTIETNIPKALISKVTIGEVSIPISTSSSTGYCTITEIAGGTRLDISYSWLKNTLLNKDSKYYLKVFYGTGSNEYAWKYIYVRSVRSSPVTGDENLTPFMAAFAFSTLGLCIAGASFAGDAKKRKKDRNA